jgi:hypothetical protein
MSAPDLVVAVVVPSGGSWKAKMSMSMIGMAMHFNTVSYALNARQAISFANKRGSILPQLRHKLVEDALQLRPKPTHILFVDSDQTFPPDLLFRLLVHDVPIVACNISTKSPHPSPTARLKGKKGGDPVPVFSTPTSPALGEVWRVGAGIMLVKAEVFEAVPKPWFHLKWVEEIQDFVGEDWWFLEQAESVGIPVMLDHRISMKVGHVGDKEYTMEDVNKEKAHGCESNSEPTATVLCAS